MELKKRENQPEEKLERTREVWLKADKDGVNVMCDGYYVCELKHTGILKVYDTSGFKVEE